jgi:hypothetical protein
MSNARVALLSAMSNDKVIQKLHQRIVKTVDDCWVWTGARNTLGYGMISHNRTLIRAHRLSFAVSSGKDPADFLVCHRCDNPPCINPNHLFLGSYADNNADMKAKGRRKSSYPTIPLRGSLNGGAVLTEALVMEARLRRANGETYQAISDSFGVQYHTIRLAVIGRSWGHMPNGIVVEKRPFQKTKTTWPKRPFKGNT